MTGSASSAARVEAWPRIAGTGNSAALPGAVVSRQPEGEPVAQVFRTPREEYTRSLLDAAPGLELQ